MVPNSHHIIRYVLWIRIVLGVNLGEERKCQKEAISALVSIASRKKTAKKELQLSSPSSRRGSGRLVGKEDPSESQEDRLSREEHPLGIPVGDASEGPQGSEVTTALCSGPVD